MKKRFLPLVVLVLMLCAFLSLATACNEEEHQHEWTTYNVKNASCTEKGIIEKVCFCGKKKFESVDSLEHVRNDDGECTLCGDGKPEHQHVYTWDVVIAPNCISKGVKAGVCDCGYLLVESIEMTDHTRNENGSCTVCGDSPSGHQHAYVWQTVLEPNCVSRGAKVGVCHCGLHTVEIVAENGHNRNENGECIVCGDGGTNHVHAFSWVTVNDSTCIKAGTKRGFCACGEQTLDFIPPSGHVRNISGECIFCGDGSTTSEHKHSYTLEAKVDATCLQVGEYNATCTCGESTVISVSGKHNVNENGFCSICGETLNVYKGEGLTLGGIQEIYERFGSNPIYENITISNIVYNVINNFYVDFEAEDYCAEDISLGNLTTKYQISASPTIAYVSNVQINNYCLSIQTADGTVTDYGIISNFTFPVQRAVKSIVVNQDKLLIVVYNDDTAVVAGKIAKSGTDIFGSEMIFRLCGSGSDEYYEVVGVSSKLTEITIPATHLGVKVASIGQGAFANNKTIKKVIIPNNVKVIREKAFHGCANLETVVFSSGLTEIGDGAFCACSSLKNMIIPTTVTKVGRLAFAVINNPIFCEASSKPTGWAEDWCGKFTEYYFASGWTKVNGIPTKK